MGFGDVIGLAIVVAGFLGFASMLTEAYKAKMRVREKELEAQGARAPLQTPDSAASERLEARLRVLERIATDKTAKLSAEIEDLREPAN
ncbi:hypothetical protein [Novosphingobium sp. B 225]|uniref:hypothetical protein n=1 Tax=Novosphingobium sp. B 225 TaxID=1961849 RepID=UPI000B4A6845|nr:hypothetical protein [Novosphingobium sp. B 225]